MSIDITESAETFELDTPVEYPDSSWPRTLEVVFQRKNGTYGMAHFAFGLGADEMAGYRQPFVFKVRWASQPTAGSS